jgi:hypothetical protein
MQFFSSKKSNIRWKSKEDFFLSRLDGVLISINRWRKNEDYSKRINSPTYNNLFQQADKICQQIVAIKGF